MFAKISIFCLKCSNSCLIRPKTHHFPCFWFVGAFEKYVGYEYESGEYQKITDVKIMNDVITKPLSFKLDYTPEVPDTGMNTAQTIYFIGLIVLLSGVGIIYANAKPEGMR